MTSERGRYSKVSRRIWNSPSFGALTQPKACGSWLFFRLLTGPELNNIPGLFQAWEGGLAQALGWSLKDFRKAFAEVEREGMAKADWKKGIVWLPAAIGHNEPESPNVVVGWRSAWQELPECSVKDEAHASLSAWAEAKGDPWAKAFAKASGKTSAKEPSQPPPNPSPNQEQEQKQEQEQEQKQKPTPSPEARFSMHPDWRPTEDVMRSFDVALIPRWGSEPLVALHRSHFCGKPSDKRTDEDWNQSCSKWVNRDWNNTATRPKKPSAAASEVIEIR